MTTYDWIAINNLVLWTSTTRITSRLCTCWHQSRTLHLNQILMRKPKSHTDTVHMPTIAVLLPGHLVVVHISKCPACVFLHASIRSVASSVKGPGGMPTGGFNSPKLGSHHLCLQTSHTPARRLPVAACDCCDTDALLWPRNKRKCCLCSCTH